MLDDKGVSAENEGATAPVPKTGDTNPARIFMLESGGVKWESTEDKGDRALFLGGRTYQQFYILLIHIYETGEIESAIPLNLAEKNSPCDCE